MPSTVKVRIKSARNLPVMDHHASVGRGGATSAATTANRAISNLRNIPNTMGSASPPSTDAYVVVTLGGHVNLTDQEEESGKQKRYTQKTKVCRRTLNPVWDEGREFLLLQLLLLLLLYYFRAGAGAGTAIANIFGAFNQTVPLRLLLRGSG